MYCGGCNTAVNFHFLTMQPVRIQTYKAVFRFVNSRCEPRKPPRASRAGAWPAGLPRVRAVGGRTFRGHPVRSSSRAAAVSACVGCGRATSLPCPARGRPPPSRPWCPPSVQSPPPATPDARARGFRGRLSRMLSSMPWPKRPLCRLAAALRGLVSLKNHKICLTENCPLRALFYPFLLCIGVKMIRTFRTPQNTFLRSSLTLLRLLSEIWRFRKIDLPLPPACRPRSPALVPGFPAGLTSNGFLQ